MKKILTPRTKQYMGIKIDNEEIKSETLTPLLNSLAEVDKVLASNSFMSGINELKSGDESQQELYDLLIDFETSFDKLRKGIYKSTKPYR